MFDTDPIVLEALVTLLVDDLFAHAEAGEAAAHAAAEIEAQEQFVVRGVDRGFWREVYADTWRPERLLLSKELDLVFRTSAAEALDVARARTTLGAALFSVLPRCWLLSAPAPQPQAAASASQPTAFTPTRPRAGPSAGGADQRQASARAGARAASTYNNNKQSPTNAVAESARADGSTPSGANVAARTASSYCAEIRGLYPLSFLEDSDGLTLAERCELRAAGLLFRRLEEQAAGSVVAGSSTLSASATRAEVVLRDQVRVPLVDLPFASPKAALRFAVSVGKAIVRLHFVNAAVDANRPAPVLTQFVPDERSGLFRTLLEGSADDVPGAVQHPLINPRDPAASARFIASLSPFEGKRDPLLVVHHTALLQASTTPGLTTDALVFGPEPGGDTDGGDLAKSNRCPVVIIIATGASAAALQQILDRCFSGALVDRVVFVVSDESVDEATSGSSALTGPLARVWCVSWRSATVDSVAAVYASLPREHRSVLGGRPTGHDDGEDTNAADSLNSEDEEVLVAGCSASDVLGLAAGAAVGASATAMSLLQVLPRCSAARDAELALVADLRRHKSAGLVAATPAAIIAAARRVARDIGAPSFARFWHAVVLPSFAKHSAEWQQWAMLTQKAATTAKRLVQRSAPGARRGSRTTTTAAQSIPALASGVASGVLPGAASPTSTNLSPYLHSAPSNPHLGGGTQRTATPLSPLRPVAHGSVAALPQEADGAFPAGGGSSTQLPTAAGASSSPPGPPTIVPPGAASAALGVAGVVLNDVDARDEQLAALEDAAAVLRRVLVR